MAQTVIPYEPNMPVLDVDEVLKLEKKSADNGTSLLELMNRAGYAVAEAAEKMLRENDSQGKSAVILAGSGNNGGDGWVATTNLSKKGCSVTLVSKSCAEKLTTEPARTAAMKVVRDREFLIALSPDNNELEKLLCESDLIIDAVLGTGFAHSEVRSPYSEWIDLANTARSNHGIPILSVDCPSGLNAQTGVAAANCMEAEETITMIAAKTGLLQEKSSPYVGKLLVAPIGVKLVI